MNTRERERKFILTGKSFAKADALLANVGELIEEGTSSDKFWIAKGVDFIRLRQNTSELTVKVTDKGTVQDRIEENVIVASLATTERYLNLVHGPSVGTLTKTFSVYSVTLGDDTHTVSLYTVLGHDEVFFEVEADTLDIVNAACEDYYLLFDLEPVDQSLFQYVLGYK